PLQRPNAKPTPFPTTYWLSGGELDRAVANLERQGLIKQLEARVATDAGFAAALEADHHRYAAARWAMLDPDERQTVDRLGFTTALRDRGVGGVINFTKIKCLHAHVAHALHDQATRSETINAVGQYVLDRLGMLQPVGSSPSGINASAVNG
ncbi:MAG: DUF501 domain-containing protein, partial [Planctomycetota bacterium]